VHRKRHHHQPGGCGLWSSHNFNHLVAIWWKQPF
jgi:hypothetical protein